MLCPVHSGSTDAIKNDESLTTGLDISLTENGHPGQNATADNWRLRRVKSISRHSGASFKCLLCGGGQHEVQMYYVVGQQESVSGKKTVIINDPAPGYIKQSEERWDAPAIVDITYFKKNDAMIDDSYRPVIGVAGHLDNLIQVEDGYIGKLTNKNEVDVYDRRRELMLDSIIPQHKKIAELNDDGRVKLATLELKAAQLDQAGIVIAEMLGSGIPEDRKIEMDVKIGFRTVAKAQLSIDGLKSPGLKTARHKVMDVFYGSRFRGVRVEGLKIQGKKPLANKLTLSWSSGNYIKSVIHQAGSGNRQKIIKQLIAIRANLAIAPITFIASSALFLIDTGNPENTVVKLIDFAHPVYRSDSGYRKIKQESIGAVSRMIDYIEAE